MKYKFIYIASLFFTISGFSQIGINNDNPQAALDIKKEGQDNEELMRFSTKPTSEAIGNGYVFFLGKELTDKTGYDLRKSTEEEVIKRIISEEFPILNRITVDNSKNTENQNFTLNEHETIKLDNVVLNTSDEDYSFNTEGNYIEINRNGEYNISATIGFERLDRNVEETGGDVKQINEKDIWVSLLKSSNNSAFEIFRSAIVTRSKDQNEEDYLAENGIGVSFSYSIPLKKGDRLKLSANTLGMLNNINTIPGSVMLSIRQLRRL